MKGLQFRVFGRGDIQFAVEVTDRESWYLTEYDLLFYLGPGGTGIVAELEGSRVGLATAALYGRAAWIGNVIVDSSRRQGGIGREMVVELVSRLWKTGATTILLYAYDRSRSLYERLGFTFDSTVWEVTVRKQGQRRKSTLDRGLKETIGRFDAKYFRQSRMEVLRHVAGRPGSIVVSATGDADNVIGYLICSPGGSDYGSEVAPFIAEGEDVVAMLTSLEEVQGPFHMYVPERNLGLLERLDMAYTQVRRVHRGFLGEAANVPTIDEHVISVGLLETG